MLRRKFLHILLFCLFLLFLISSCSPVIQKKEEIPSIELPVEIEITPVIPSEVEDSVPVEPQEKRIRVGLLENVKKISFQTHGHYSIFSQGKKIYETKAKVSTWNVIFSNGYIIVQDDDKIKLTVSKNLFFKKLSHKAFFKLSNMQRGKGWHYQSQGAASYRGSLDLVQHKSSLILVNEVELDNYLYGVVPAEMPSQAPLEALKAQAVVSRTNVFSNLGKKYVGKPYQLFADVYSQVYKGMGSENPRSTKAVNQTHGQVLVFNNKIITAVFHSVCGGMTASNHLVWSGGKIEYLQTVKDYNSKKKYDLTKDSDFRKWYNDPQVQSYCDLRPFNPPRAFNYAKKYYRWSKKISNKQLRKQIKKTTGKDPGVIKHIKILKRGKSGKINSLQVVGKRLKIRVFKELNIRKRLSSPPLYSANFYMDYIDKNSNGLPEYFIFRGTGFGHGVGMCQIGACGMAYSGFNYETILKHYYRGVSIIDME